MSKKILMKRMSIDLPVGYYRLLKKDATDKDQTVKLSIEMMAINKAIVLEKKQLELFKESKVK
jgi:hypothetical protein